MILLIISICIVILHALYNLVNFLRYPIVEKNLLYSYTSDSKLKINAATHKSQILNYIKNAGVKDKHVVVSQPSGYGKIVSSNVSVFDNILNNRQDIAQMVMECLLEAKGNYWSKFINSFNPFYWIKFILFIPKNILSYLGLSEESMIIKIFQLLYWFISIACTFLLAIFPGEIKNFVLSILHIS